MTNIPINKQLILNPAFKNKGNPLSVNQTSSTIISILVTFSLFLTLFTVAFFIAKFSIDNKKSPSNYNECSKARGSRLLESYPAVCITKDGLRFVQPLSEEEKRLLEPRLETN